MKKQQRRGFTIVELVIVIAVIAILAAVLIPTFSNMISKANDSKALQEARNAYTTYMIDAAESGATARYFVYQADDTRFVAIDSGSALGVYETAEAALKSMLPDADTADLVLIGDLLVYGGEAVIPDTTPTDWTGASTVFVGDSITYGSSTTKIYHEYLKEMLGFGSVANKGIGGSCISIKSNYGSTNTPLIKRYTTIPDAELIVIFMGTNDFGHATPLGTVNDNTDISFYGALNVILPAVKEAHPNSQLVVMTPIHRYHQTALNGGTGMNYPEDDKPNTAGATLADYVNAIKTVCQKNDILVIDLFNLFTLDPSDEQIRTQYMPDGLHPNAAGHELMAEIISEELKKIPRKEKADTPVEPDISEPDYTLILGNHFASGYENNAKRACTKYNIYLTKGTIVILENDSQFEWAISPETSVNSINTAGQYLSTGWDEGNFCVIPNDGWYGFTIVKTPEATFDFAGADSDNLLDYFTICEQLSMENDNRFAPNASTASKRLSSQFNLYLPANATVTFKDGTDVTHWAISKTSTAVSDDRDYQKDAQGNAWRNPDTFTVLTAGYYGFTFKNDSISLDHTAYDLFDFIEITGYQQ